MSEEGEPHLGSTATVMYASTCLALVCIAGVMSGLTVGLMSIDPLKLKLLKLEGTEEDKRRAKKLEPILSRHHLLLVTLLLVNASAMEALPLFLDRIVPSWLAIILSVSFVLLFGEILPQALCTSNPLKIGAMFSWVIRFCMFVLYPIAAPIAWVLDKVLEHDDSHILFKRSELRAIVDMHKLGDIEMPHEQRVLLGHSDTSSSSSQHLNSGESDNVARLTIDEVKILKGALDMKQKCVADALTPLEKVFMLEDTAGLDERCMAEIIHLGHSRIPVFHKSRHNVTGMVLVKRMIVADPKERRPITQFSTRKPLVVSPDMPLYDVLNRFQTGRSHLALVASLPDTVRECMQSGRPVPFHVRLLGIITLEDVMEELIQEEIEDESDFFGYGAHDPNAAHLGVMSSRTAVTVHRAVYNFKRLLRRSRTRKKWTLAPVISAAERRGSFSVTLGNGGGSVNMAPLAIEVRDNDVEAEADDVPLIH